MNEALFRDYVEKLRGNFHISTAGKAVIYTDYFAVSCMLPTRKEKAKGEREGTTPRTLASVRRSINKALKDPVFILNIKTEDMAAALKKFDGFEHMTLFKSSRGQNEIGISASRVEGGKRLDEQRRVYGEVSGTGSTQTTVRTMLMKRVCELADEVSADTLLIMLRGPERTVGVSLYGHDIDIVLGIAKAVR